MFDPNDWQDKNAQLVAALVLVFMLGLIVGVVLQAASV